MCAIYAWWNQRPKNRMIRFLSQRLPSVIFWELWVHFNQCKYGGESPSAARVIFKITKDEKMAMLGTIPSQLEIHLH